MTLKEYIFGMLGDRDPSQMLFMFSWAILGSVTMIFVDVVKRDPTSATSPLKFNLWYFLRDNVVRLFATLLCLIIAIRFSLEWLGVDPMNMWAGLGIGLISDGIPLMLKKFRNSLRDKYSLNPPNKMSTRQVGYPTIDVNVDTLISTTTAGNFDNPTTGVNLADTDSRFAIVNDENDMPVLCETIETGAALPYINGPGFSPQIAAEFIGARPPRYRPR